MKSPFGSHPKNWFPTHANLINGLTNKLSINLDFTKEISRLCYAPLEMTAMTKQKTRGTCHEFLLPLIAFAPQRAHCSTNLPSHKNRACRDQKGEQSRRHNRAAPSLTPFPRPRSTAACDVPSSFFQFHPQSLWLAARSRRLQSQNNLQWLKLCLYPAKQYPSPFCQK